MVECRYSKSGSVQQSLASVGVMVKTPASTLPATVVSDGLYGVQLRIAKGSMFGIALIIRYIFGQSCKSLVSLLFNYLMPTDRTYSSYLPSNSQPLQLLLGAPVYLELRLLSPKPEAVILVSYCIAYPRSAKNALVLVYEGYVWPSDSISI